MSKPYATLDRSKLREWRAPLAAQTNGTKMSERKYLPDLPELIDRLCIVQMKEIFIPEARGEYKRERAEIMDDIDLIVHNNTILSNEIRAIIMLTLANRFIWENEAAIRDQSSTEDDAMKLKRLRATHSINGVRSKAKNVLAETLGGRKDYKVDCLAADLIPEFGNWDVL